MTNLTNARIVLPGGVATGTLHVDGGRLAAPPAGPGETVDLGGRYVVPGFVDMHVQGGAGASYQTGRPEEAERAARFHLAHGTTTTVASLVTGTPDELADAVTGLADLAGRLKTLQSLLFARVAIYPDEPPRVLPEKEGAVLKRRFRAALGLTP